MAKSEFPAPPPDPFVCVVPGRPVSVQTGLNRDVRKSRKYHDRRDEIRELVGLAISEATGDRGFAAWEGPVRLGLAWCAPLPVTPAEPDLDAVAKPYMDAVSGEGRVVREDRQVRDLRVVRYNVNGDLRQVPGALGAVTSGAGDAGQFVVIIVRPLSQPDLLPPADVADRDD